MRNIPEEREPIYGPFEQSAWRAQAIIEQLLPVVRIGPRPTAVQAQAFMMIATKLSRLAHNPTHADSWADIIGYCQLVLEELNKPEASLTRSPPVQPEQNTFGNFGSGFHPATPHSF